MTHPTHLRVSLCILVVLFISAVIVVPNTAAQAAKLVFHGSIINHEDPGIPLPEFNVHITCAGCSRSGCS